MKNLFLTLLFIFTFCLITKNIQAQNKISIQGILKDDSGAAIDDGDQSVTFRLYDVEEGGTPIWEEAATIEVRGGIYSHLLGSSTTLTADLFGNTVYLAIVVNNRETTPRTELTYSPYTISAAGIASNDGSIAIDGEGKFIFTNNNTTYAPGVFFEKNNVRLGDLAFSDADGDLVLKTRQEDKDLVFGTNNSERFRIGDDGVSELRHTEAVTLVLKGDTNNDETTEAYHPSLIFSQDGGSVQSHLGFYASANGPSTSENSFGIRVAEDMVFETDDTERMRIKADGDIQLEDDAKIFGLDQIVGHNDLRFFGSGDGTGTADAWITSDGYFHVNNIQEGDYHNLQWDPTSKRLYYHNSTRRSKRNISPLEDDFTLILQAQPKTYTRSHNPDRWELGYIAEEMDSLGLTKLVSYDTKGIPDGFNYEMMILYVVEVLKLQQARIEELEAKEQEAQQLQALKKENETLKAALQKQNDEFSSRLEQLEALLKTNMDNKDK